MKKLLLVVISALISMFLFLFWLGWLSSRTQLTIDTATLAGIFDPPKLGKAEITALANHLAAQLLTIHAQGIIGAIAHLTWRPAPGVRRR